MMLYAFLKGVTVSVEMSKCLQSSRERNARHPCYLANTYTTPKTHRLAINWVGQSEEWQRSGQSVFSATGPRVGTSRREGREVRGEAEPTQDQITYH